VLSSSFGTGNVFWFYPYLNILKCQINIQFTNPQSFHTKGSSVCSC